MYVLIIIFIIMALVVGLFSMFLVGREFVEDERAKRQQKEETAEEPAPQPVAEEPAPVIEDEICVDDLPEEEPEYIEVVPDNTIAFSAGSQTLDEKYLQLAPEYKGYYDEIVRYAMAVEGSKRFKNVQYEEYKVGKNRLVRLKIKRDVVICELVIPNLAFKNYISDNKIAMKQAPATIKVTDEVALAAVKDSIGIAVEAIQEERAYKKEQARIRRRQQRAAARETAKSAEEQSQPTAEPQTESGAETDSAEA